MFGYTIPMEPMMRSEEVAAYRGYYCETCHQLRDGYGVMSTIIVSYEMTFANLVLNSVLDDGEIIKVPDTGRFCVFRHSKRHKELLKRLAAYTVLVANNGLIDDKMDGPSVKSNRKYYYIMCVGSSFGLVGRKEPAGYGGSGSFYRSTGDYEGACY